MTHWNIDEAQLIREQLCSIVDCATLVQLDRTERYFNGLVVCDNHAAEIDGY